MQFQPETTTLNASALGYSLDRLDRDSICDDHIRMTAVYLMFLRCLVSGCLVGRGFGHPGALCAGRVPKGFGHGDLLWDSEASSCQPIPGNPRTPNKPDRAVQQALRRDR